MDRKLLEEFKKMKDAIQGKSIPGANVPVVEAWAKASEILQELGKEDPSVIEKNMDILELGLTSGSGGVANEAFKIIRKCDATKVMEYFKAELESNEEEKIKAAAEAVRSISTGISGLFATIRSRFNEEPEPKKYPLIGAFDLVLFDTVSKLISNPAVYGFVRINLCVSLGILSKNKKSVPELFKNALKVESNNICLDILKERIASAKKAFNRYNK